MNLTADKGCFNMSLQRACLIIGGVFLVFGIIGGIVTGGIIAKTYSGLIGFILTVLCNVALVFGAWKESKWPVFVWLLYAIFYFVSWPFAFLGIIFNFGDYRAASGTDSVVLMIISQLITLVIFLFCTRLVYSYFRQLHNRSSTPAVTVVA